MAANDLPARNNCAPTPFEQAFLRSLVNKEEEALKFVREKQDYANAGNEHAQDIVKTKKKILSQAETRHQLATQLVRALEECIEVVSAVGKDEALGLSSDSITMDGENSTRTQRIRQQRDNAVQQLRVRLDEAEVSVRDETDAVKAATEELQGALSAESFSSQDLAMWTAQIAQIEAILAPMVNRLRPIWRVSDDLWVKIFYILTDQSFDMWDQAAWNEVTSKRGPWHQLFSLLAVCRRWRFLLQSVPALWQYPLLPLRGNTNKWSEESLEYHLKFSNSNIRQLTITSDSLSNTFSDVLKEKMSQIKFAESLRCNFTKVGGALAEKWWLFYPPMQELYITDFSLGTGAELPSRLCASIRKVVTRRFLISFEAATPLLEELRLWEPSTRRDNRASMQEIRKILKANGGSLRILEVTGPFRVVVEEIGHNELDSDSLCNLQDITMTMGTLVTLLGLKCRLPKIHTLRLLGAIDTTLQAWERFLAISNRSLTIQVVYFGKLSTDAAVALDPFIAALKNKELEVHDESGEYILVSLIDLPLRDTLCFVQCN